MLKGRYKSILFLRSAQGSQYLSDGLRAAGILVDDIPLYGVVNSSDSRLDRLIEQAGEVDIFAFTSSSTARNLISRAREMGREEKLRNALAKATVTAIGKPTAEELSRQGVAVDVIPESFTFEAMGIQFEVGYARQASGLLGTRHTFVGVQDRDYPDLLVQTIETLAQPMVMAENDPGHMVLARHLAAGSPARHHVFTGQGADVLQGMDLEECTTGLGPLRYALRETWRLFGIPIFRKKLGGLPDVWRYLFTAGTYRSLRVPPALFDPVNRVAIPYTSFETPRHFLGDRVVLDCLEYRLGLAEDVFPGRTLAERLHHIDMFTLGYGPAVAFEALFAASNQVLIPFYFDQDVVRLANSVSPEVRYRHNGEVKPIPKSILRLKSLGELVHQRKGSSGFWRDFQSWMMTGMLREMVHSIERPGFISRRDFASLVGNKVPYGYDLVWPLLTYDIFRKRVARRYSPPGPGQAGS